MRPTSAAPVHEQRSQRYARERGRLRRAKSCALSAKASVSNSSASCPSLSRSTPGLNPKECGMVFGAGRRRADAASPRPARIARLTASLKGTPSSWARCFRSPAKSSSSVRVVRMSDIIDRSRLDVKTSDSRASSFKRPAIITPNHLLVRRCSCKARASKEAPERAKIAVYWIILRRAMLRIAAQDEAGAAVYSAAIGTSATGRVLIDGAGRGCAGA